MKTSRSTGLPACFSLLLALIGMTHADVPKKAPLSRYQGLWLNSPFTSKPPPPEAGPVNNPLDDYALLGVSSIGEKGETRVTLINKKTPDERITVDSGATVKGFKIVKVNHKQGNPLGTVVEMMSGSQKGTVSFDEKLLTIAAPKAPPQAQVPPQPGAQPQPPPQPGQPIPRQPRPRVVPPPVPQPAAQAQPVQQNQRPQRRGN
ncbi:hypothetical protein JIN84_11035 [Luteolibacter yonseiensis]|uniref:Uncharacterized protein n=1 Tax=Luteolibacter yonseiensis TaxID=1144680 RepID=A0A934R525_9BACT|nr:hypothetical protein [Luteolibacter yonseiensis]MBK1816148.1 hypothetical protein [Luteolibacter yonseiensis]